MKVLTPGYYYLLNHMDGTGNEMLQFVQSEEREGKFVTVIDGTTNEEVLEVMLDRLKHMNSKVPHKENAVAIAAIEDALASLNRRTQERRARGVEGTPAE